MEEITVRTWIEKFKNKEFDKSDFKTQVKAGWIDWFCPVNELSGRLQKMGEVIQKIEEDFILDNFNLTFYNNCPFDYPLYDSVRFTPVKSLNKEFEFMISFDYAYDEYKYKIYTEKNNWETEFCCMTDEEIFDSLEQLVNEYKKEEMNKYKFDA